MDGLREGLHHSGGTSRLVTKELGGGQRPNLGGLQERIGPGDGVRCVRLGTGEHPLQHGEQPKHHEGLRPRQACGEPASIANMAPERLVGERRMYAEARAGVVNQLQSLERHPLLAFLLENTSNSEL